MLFTSAVGADDRSASSKDLAVAAQLVDICGRLMPNNPEVEKEIEDLGFVTARWNGRFHILEDLAGGVSVIVSGLDTYDKHCGILVKGMEVDQAEKLIVPWLDRIDAIPSDANSSKATKTWSGLIEGFLASVSIFEESQHDRISGAWVRLVLRDKPI